MRESTLISLLIGALSIVLGVAALTSQQMRDILLIGLVVSIASISTLMYIFFISTEQRRAIKLVEKIENKFKAFERDKDIYKKLYKLDFAVNKLMKNRKGAHNGFLVVAAVAILILVVYVILRVAGVL